MTMATATKRTGAKKKERRKRKKKREKVLRLEIGSRV